MIVPRSRLLFWVAAVVLPFSVVAAVLPAFLVLSVVFMAMLLSLVLIDAALACGSLSGVEVKLPEVVRLSKERPGSIDLRIRNRQRKSRRLRVGLAFPREIQPGNEDLHVALPADSEWSRVDWPCTPLQRGNYFLDRVYVECGSPIGFWAVRAGVPAKSEIRVYPNLFTERKNLAALFLNRGSFGLHAQRQVGKGREFEKLREYIAGDSYDEIHWKATAKRGHPVTKVFQIERTQEIYVIIDASRLTGRVAAVPSSAFRVPRSEVTSSAAVSGDNGQETNSELETRNSEPTTSNSKLGTQNSEPTTLERFITAALVLGLAAEQQGDLFGLLTFTDKVEAFIRARNGKAHYNACRDALYTLEPKSVTPDFDEVATFIRLRLRRRALLVFLTALDDPVLSESFVRNMDLLCRQHLVLVNMIKPPGADPLFTRPDVQSVDDLYEHLGGHMRWQKLRELEKILQRRGVRFSLLENEKMSAQLVSQYIGVKRRQAL